MYDINRNKVLEDEEIQKYLKDAIHVKRKLTKKDVQDFMGAYDKNGDGKISKV